MINVQVYLEDKNGNQICFKHAVKAALENDERISMHAHDDSDCGASGAWLIGSCKKCEEEILKDTKIET